MPPHKVAAVVDGFNLYHSVEDAIRTIQAANVRNLANKKPLMSEHMKWLDIRAVCQSYMSALREAVGAPVELGEVFYFSAFAKHRGGATVGRHMDFVSALTLRGVQVEMASFKRKDVDCHKCGHKFPYHAEKQTDVAVAAKLIELAATNGAGTVVVVSGDTDLIPAFKTVRRLNPAVRIVSLFPYDRESPDLGALAHQTFSLSTSQYRKWQMPDPVPLPNGEGLPKPVGW